ncbi:MAG: glucokinase, partial [Pseudomonadota bacterium]
MISAPLVAVDVGGTHTKIRMVSSIDHEATLEVEQVARNRTDMLEILGDTLSANTDTPPVWCVLSAAGPVEDGEHVRMTNWPSQRRISLADLGKAGV